LNCEIMAATNSPPLHHESSDIDGPTAVKHLCGAPEEGARLSERPVVILDRLGANETHVCSGF
jgi:hypothetical protein